MILLLVSVWMRPSLGLQRPRTVIGMRPPGQIDIELLREGIAELVARQFVEEALERRAEGELARPGSCRSRRSSDSRG